MKFKIVKEKRNRERFARKEARLKMLKAMVANTYLDERIRQNSFDKLSKVKGLEHKLVNRCVVTGRSRGVLRKFKVSRMVFKKLGMEGKLVGVRKASW